MIPTNAEEYETFRVQVAALLDRLGGKIELDEVVQRALLKLLEGSKDGLHLVVEDVMRDMVPDQEFGRGEILGDGPFDELEDLMPASPAEKVNGGYKSKVWVLELEPLSSFGGGPFHVTIHKPETLH